MKLILTLSALLASAGLGWAQTSSYAFNENIAIPDGNPVGIALSTNLTGVAGGNIQDVTVNLDIAGGFNGDLYAYLSGPNGGFAVLLNRTGVTADNSFGYSDAGFNITFDDSGAADNIHFYQNDDPVIVDGQLTGTWASDGENISPESSEVGSTPSTATLTSFDGTNPDGAWTLFIADLSSGGQSTLVNWSLTINTVPEPAMWGLAGLGVLTLVGIQRWKKL